MRRPGYMLREALGELFRAPATVSYPRTKASPPPRFRGKLVFHADRCVGCRLCMKDCPSAAITIDKLGERQFEAILDLDKCVFCCQCVSSCNKSALEASPDFELAVLDKGKLKVRINIDEKGQ